MAERHFSEAIRRQVPLAEYPEDWIELTCQFCDRRGRYRKASLLKRFGPDWGLVSVLNVLSADCPRIIKNETGKGCGAYYANLRTGY